MARYVEERIGHLNLWRESGDTQAISDLTKMSHFCSLITVNEGRLHVDDVKAFCRKNIEWWYVYERDGTANEKNNIILYKTAIWICEQSWSRKMCDKVPGSPDRYMLSARMLHSPSHQKIVVRVTHFNSHIQNPNWWRLPRWPQYGIQKRRLVRAVKMNDQLQVISADVNADYRRPFVRQSVHYPYGAFDDIGVRCSYDKLGMPNKGTHGHRLIDATWIKTWNGKIKWIDQEIVDDLFSDHNGLVVVIQIEVKSVRSR